MKHYLVILAGLIGFALVSCDNTAKTDAVDPGDIDSVELLTNLIIEDSSNYTLFLDRARVYLQRGTVFFFYIIP